MRTDASTHLVRVWFPRRSYLTLSLLNQRRLSWPAYSVRHAPFGIFFTFHRKTWAAVRDLVGSDLPSRDIIVNGAN